MPSSTFFSVIDISSKISLKFMSSKFGMLVSFSFVKTLEKYSLRVFAVSWSLDVRFPFGVRSLATDVFVFECLLT